MIKIKRSLIWTAGAIAVTVMIIGALRYAPWLEAYATLRPLPDTIQEQVDEAISYGLDGIVVYVDRGKDKTPEFYSAGWKDRKRKVPADPHAVFKIASISKLYIAAATAMLVSDGKLQLDDTLAQYFPDLADRIDNADRITLRMLLQHKSGIPDWVEDPDFPWDRSLQAVDDYLELILDDPAEFKPGAQYDYSNSNYLLLGMILDHTLGYDHQDFIKSEILTPLGLTHTFGTLGEVDAEKVSSGYYTGYDGDVKMSDVIAPGVSMLATAQDLGIFLRALNDGSLLSKEAQEIYTSVYIYDHTGQWAGYSSIARYHKDIDTVVIQLINTNGGKTKAIRDIIYKRIVEIIRSEQR